MRLYLGIVKSILSCFYAALLLLIVSCGDKTESVQPSVGVITESVYASGRVKSADQYSVYPTVSGVLLQTFVTAGEHVDKGDTLFLLENVSARLSSENAKELLELAKDYSREGSSMYEEMELSVKTAYEKYQLDSSLFQRQKRLWESNVGSKLEVEQRELAFSSSKNAWIAAKARFEQLKSRLTNEYHRAQIGYDISRDNASDFVIKSNIDGTVYNVLKEDNELVSPQTQLAVIGGSASFILELEVDEYDVVKVMQGQEVIISMDSYKGRVFSGHVTSIDPIMDERSRTFRVEAVFDEAPEKLFPNLTLEANIVLQSKKNAVIIPRRFLHEGKYVYISENEKREIKTGLIDIDKVEVIEGLDSNTTIFLPPNTP